MRDVWIDEEAAPPVRPAGSAWRAVLGDVFQFLRSANLLWWVAVVAALLMLAVAMILMQPEGVEPFIFTLLPG